MLNTTVKNICSKYREHWASPSKVAIHQWFPLVSHLLEAPTRKWLGNPEMPGHKLHNVRQVQVSKALEHSLPRASAASASGAKEDRLGNGGVWRFVAQFVHGFDTSVSTSQWERGKVIEATASGWKGTKQNIATCLYPMIVIA